MRPAVILDRDGVINDHRDYVNTPDDFFLFEYSAEAIRLLNEAGFVVVVATNQGGVGLGFMTKEALAAIHDKMRASLAEEGAFLADIAACVHAPREGCRCRKPKPGLLFELQERNDLDLARSYMVGDRETDVEAGKAAGTKTVLIGRGPSQADFIARNLLDAARWITTDARTRE